MIIKDIMNNISIKNICIILIILFIILKLKNKFSIRESFTIQKDKYINHTNDTLYDSFYASVYDKLLHCSNKNSFEILEILDATKISQQSHKNILDIGSGTGHHCKLFTNNDCKCTGLDKSKAMIDISKQNFPELTFIHGDANTSLLFQYNSYNMITILYFTIYYFKNKIHLFQNCYNWLDYGGYMVIHLVNKSLFDPIVSSANPLDMISVQDYAKERIVDSSIIFNHFKYKSHFELDHKNDVGEFKEKFIFHDNKVRENNHTLYFETQTKILTLAKSIGFIMISKINMYDCGYDNQYLYVLQKPK